MSTFTRMLVPGHAGKPEIAGTRFLDDSALAKVKNHIGSGDQACDLKCGVPLRELAGAWKIGAENRLSLQSPQRSGQTKSGPKPAFPVHLSRRIRA
ncbi:hypothetical protein [Dokdonella sp.]|uniref:hypothetical protein n=1 Tax=Dokdonella sp. TaxID=2291710 RepID=UPI002C5F59DF|nr:hypothetical protein [Dokdonella sp.]HOX70138.1 hypothetical protein [Dokdonella sp.]